MTRQHGGEPEPHHRVIDSPVAATLRTFGVSDTILEAIFQRDVAGDLLCGPTRSTFTGLRRCPLYFRYISTRNRLTSLGRLEHRRGNFTAMLATRAVARVGARIARREYNFASTQYKQCFGGLPIADGVQLRKDTIAYLDTFDEQSRCTHHSPLNSPLAQVVVQ